MKNKILYKRSLRTCIIMLVVCIVFKLFGVKWFDLNTSIPMLQELNKTITNSLGLSILYSWIFTFINFYLFSIIVTKAKTNIYFILCCLLNALMCVGLKYNLIDILHYKVFILDFICLYDTCSFMNNRKPCFKEFCLTMLLNYIYQVISLFIKEIGYGVGNYTMIEGVLFNLDYYIMLAITYLYLKKGDTSLCQIFHQFFSYLKEKLLKKHSKNYSENKSDVYDIRSHCSSFTVSISLLNSMVE